MMRIDILITITDIMHTVRLCCVGGGGALCCQFCKLCILFIKKYCIFIISGKEKSIFSCFEDN